MPDATGGRAGIANRYLHLYLSHRSFRRTYRVQTSIPTAVGRRAMIEFLILGAFLARRRLPRRIVTALSHPALKLYAFFDPRANSQSIHYIYDRL